MKYPAETSAITIAVIRIARGDALRSRPWTALISVAIGGAKPSAIAARMTIQRVQPMPRPVPRPIQIRAPAATSAATAAEDVVEADRNSTAGPAAWLSSGKSAAFRFDLAERWEGSRSSSNEKPIVPVQETSGKPVRRRRRRGCPVARASRPCWAPPKPKSSHERAAIALSARQHGRDAHATEQPSRKTRNPATINCCFHCRHSCSFCPQWACFVRGRYFQKDVRGHVDPAENGVADRGHARGPGA